MASQEERSRKTRAKLIAAFRGIVLAEGLEQSTTQRLLERTGLSKGALYHHFASKLELVEAMYEAEARSAMARAAAKVAAGTPPLTRLKETCAAWLVEVQAHDVSLILFEIGPTALGYARARTIEDKLSTVAFERLLDEAATKCEIRRDPPPLIARLLNAMMAEASIAQREGDSAASQTVMQAIDALLATLKS